MKKLMSALFFSAAFVSAALAASSNPAEVYIDNITSFNQELSALLTNFYSDAPDADLSSKMTALKEKFNKGNKGLAIADLKFLDMDMNTFMDKLIEMFRDFEQNKVRDPKLRQEVVEWNTRIKKRVEELAARGAGEGAE